MSFSSGDSVEVIDCEGVWRTAKVLEVLPEEKYRVRYENWTSRHNEVVFQPEMRSRLPTNTTLPLKRRREKTVVTAFGQYKYHESPETLVRDDKVEYIEEQTYKTSVVHTNDPMNRKLVLEDGNVVQYADILSGQIRVQSEATVKRRKRVVSQHDHESTAQRHPRKKPVKMVKQNGNIAKKPRSTKRKTEGTGRSGPVSKKSRKIKDSVSDTVQLFAVTVNGISVHCGSFLEIDGYVLFVNCIYSSDGETFISGHKIRVLNRQFISQIGNVEIPLSNATEASLVTPPLNKEWKDRISSTKKVAAARVINNDTNAVFRDTVVQQRKIILGSYIRREVQRALSSRSAARALPSIPCDLMADAHLLGLNIENNFTEIYVIDYFDIIDNIVGKGWEFKKLGSRFMCVTYMRIKLDLAMLLLRLSIGITESQSDLSENYREDIASQVQAANM